MKTNTKQKIQKLLDESTFLKDATFEEIRDELGDGVSIIEDDEIQKPMLNLYKGSMSIGFSDAKRPNNKDFGAVWIKVPFAKLEQELFENFESTDDDKIAKEMIRSARLLASVLIKMSQKMEDAMKIEFDGKVSRVNLKH